MNLTPTRLDVQKGERIRVTLFGASWTIGASAHTANEPEDVGFHVRSLVHTLPAGPVGYPSGEMDPPGFPNTILWAELEAKQTASLQTQLTEDLYVARAWPAPATSPAASSTRSIPTTWSRGPRSSRRGAARVRLPNRVRARQGGRGVMAMTAFDWRRLTSSGAVAYRLDESGRIDLLSDTSSPPFDTATVRDGSGGFVDRPLLLDWRRVGPFGRPVVGAPYAGEPLDDDEHFGAVGRPRERARRRRGR